MAVTLKQFIRSLSDSGLMTADEVRAFLDGLPPDHEPTDARELAKELFRQKRLTRFQTRALYQGKTKGLVLGNYVVLDKLGRGGMGTVYKARHKLMKRVVALKVLPSSATRSPRAVKRFHREVEAAAKLDHPNVVTAHDADQAEGIHFLVMECVEGHDLSFVVRKHGRLPVGGAIDYTIQAAKGLEYAHSQGVIHRDIKPSNLVLDFHGTVKVLDMGLARINEAVGPTDSTPQESLTGTGSALGTVDYMPPEQAENTKTVDQRADIYSLGCTLFYLLNGHAVYHEATTVGKLLAHREAPIPSLRDERNNVPENLEAVFQRMVAKSPDDRYGSMTEVIHDLEECAQAHHNQVDATTDLASVEVPPVVIETHQVLEAEETPPDESLPLDLPVISPVDEFRRTRTTDNKGQLIAGAVVAGVALLVVLLVAVFLATRGGDAASTAEADKAKPSASQGKVDRGRSNPSKAAPSVPATTESGKETEASKYLIRTRRGHTHHVFDVSFSPDGSTLASGGNDGVKLWDVSEFQKPRPSETDTEVAESPELVSALEGHTGPVTFVAFHPNGLTLASGSLDKTVRLWDVVTGQCRRTLTGPGIGMWTCAAFSPDGSTLASGNGDLVDIQDTTVRLWDVATGELRLRLEGHSSGVRSVAFSPDGTLLASGGLDKTIKLWEPTTGELKGTFDARVVVSSVAFGPDGSLLASGGYDSAV